ncbi:hypothetical protein ES707_09950 [subsurface metagenome]|jgi:hypothetical protein
MVSSRAQAQFVSSMPKVTGALEELASGRLPADSLGRRENPYEVKRHMVGALLMGAGVRRGPWP